MIAQNDNSVMVRKLPIEGVYAMARAASGVFMARSISSGGENIQNVTNTPTARNATSLTMDSVAIASIRPCWCSVASAWRVPNSTANTAIVSITISAMSPMIGMLEDTLSSLRMVSSEEAIALSWSAIYGTEPTIAISATVAATAW